MLAYLEMVLLGTAGYLNPKLFSLSFSTLNFLMQIKLFAIFPCKNLVSLHCRYNLVIFSSSALTYAGDMLIHKYASSP